MKLYIGGGIIKKKTNMKTDKKSLEIIKLDSEIMDCFESDEELAVISGGKGIIETIVDFTVIAFNVTSSHSTK